MSWHSIVVSRCKWALCSWFTSLMWQLRAPFLIYLSVLKQTLLCHQHIWDYRIKHSSLDCFFFISVQLAESWQPTSRMSWCPNSSPCSCKKLHWWHVFEQTTYIKCLVKSILMVSVGLGNMAKKTYIFIFGLHCDLLYLLSNKKYFRKICILVRIIALLFYCTVSVVCLVHMYSWQENGNISMTF